MNRDKTAILRHLYEHRAAVSVAALPAFVIRSFDWKRVLRPKIALFAICLAVIASATYVTSVNLMLLSGQTIERNRTAIKVIQREITDLERSLTERQSPAWLENTSRTNGMVAVSAVRYLTREESLAFSR
jgi:hypothetical protein